MFKKLGASTSEAVTIFVDGQALEVSPGDSVAAALLGVGTLRFRQSAKSGAPRSPHCMMGSCFECLVEIDGIPDRQACMAFVAEGMTIKLAGNTADD